MACGRPLDGDAPGPPWRVTPRGGGGALRLLSGLLVGVLLALSAVASARADLLWEPLGGAPPEGPAASAVAPLADGTVLLLRGGIVLRRPLGGDWVEVAAGERGSYLAASQGARPLAVAVLGDALLASLDGGQTWRPTGLPVDNPQLELSPAFDDDGTALYTAAGRLFKSVDGGATWTELIPVAGQRVQRALFSPTYAQDHTMVAAVVSGPFPYLMADRPNDQPATDHDSSAGLLISTDGGLSWSAPGDGPSLDGVPYRHIQAVALSPAFGIDHVVYVYAWGPRTPAPFVGGGLARQWQGALFRSADGGQSWRAVQTSGPPAFTRTFATLALSPVHHLDDTLFSALFEIGPTPASAGCRLLRSTDGGANWTEVLQRGSYESCRGVVVSPRYADDRVLLAGKQSWLYSQDGGATWANLGRPDIVSPPVFAPDLWLYAAGREGAWRLPPFPDRGDLPDCPLQPAGGFGRLWRANDALRADLGCPGAPEQRITAHIVERPEGRLIQLEAGGSWLLLHEDGSLELLAAEQAPSETPAALELVRQEYAGGVLLWNPRPSATILVLDRVAQRWRMFPDLP